LYNLFKKESAEKQEEVVAQVQNVIGCIVELLKG